MPAVAVSLKLSITQLCLALLEIGKALSDVALQITSVQMPARPIGTQLRTNNNFSSFVMQGTSKPVAVIGAGPGGLAAAVALVEAGQTVIVVERGDEFVAGHARTLQYNFESSPLPWQTAKEEWLGPIEITRSLGIGGSTLYFQAVSYMPTDKVLNSWGLPLATIKKVEKEVTNFLRIAGDSQPAHPLNDGSRQLLAGAKKLGWRAEASKVAILSRSDNGRPACNHCGQCVFGCLPKDKSSADNTWYPRLLKNKNVRIIKNAQVKKILLLDKETVSGLLINDGEKHYEIEVKAVVVAAGVMETPYLLKSSSQALAPQGLGNDFVGKYLSGSLLYSLMVSLPGTTNGYAGVPIDIAVQQFLKEGILLCQGRNLGGITGPASLAKFYARHFGPVGLREWVQKHYGSLAVLAGFAEYQGGPTDGIQSTNKKFDIANSEKSISQIKKIMLLLQKWSLASGAKPLFTPDIVSEAPTGAMLRGTCKIAKTSEVGAVMPDGRLYGYKNLVVADASVLGSGIIAHPSLPVQVLGYYFGRQLAGRLAV